MARIKSGSRKFTHQHGQQLCEFFGNAQIKYASGEIQPTALDDGGFQITYEKGVWRYSDIWHGGEPYAGLTTIYKDGVDCFCMVYFGRIMPYANLAVVQQDLMEALQHPKPTEPWRGPRKFVTAHGLHYYNEWTGGTRRFSGQERILSQDGKETLYEASYMGGVVNQD